MRRHIVSTLDAGFPEFTITVTFRSHLTPGRALMYIERT